MIAVNTPIELYKNIWVKREDLACPPPGPPFSKIRGLEAKLLSLQKSGINTVGYMDTSVSMASWGVSYFCQQFGMHAVIFYPNYKMGFKDNLEKHIKIWKDFGAEIIPLDKPQRQKINFYRAKNILLKNWPNAFMLEQGFPYQESVEETAKQVKLLPKNLFGGSIVISIGSGVICSGVVKGLLNYGEGETIVFGITVSPKDLPSMEKKIRTRSNDIFSSVPLVLIDSKYEYTQIVEMEIPFSCNLYYDAKAWEWLIKHEKELKQPIIFWNIGGN